MAGSYNKEQARYYVSDKLSMSTRDTQKYQVYDNEVYERRYVHQFRMSDVEDPDLYVAQPIYEWQQTDQGKWIMEHAKDPTYHLHADPITFGYVVSITAHIKPKHWTEYVLRGWYTG
jgi:hypothetical protein